VLYFPVNFAFPPATACARAQTVLARIVCTVIHDIGQCGKASRSPNEITVYVKYLLSPKKEKP
jgi:hypothetical protein